MNIQFSRRKKIWINYFIIKILYMVIAIGVVSKLTTLGDTFDYFYLNKPQSGELPYLLFSSTYIMNLLGHNLYLIFGKYIANIPFIFISLYGVYYPLKRFSISNNQLVFILILLSFPSFGMWTSICSKEAIGVFFMGIILGYIIDIIEKVRYKPNLIELVSFYLLFVFKTQYVPAIFALISYIIIINKFHLKQIGKTVLFFLGIFIFFIILYLIRDYAQALAEILPKHFSFNSLSTRENTIWVNKYDIYFNSLYGMFVAFMGPTWNEALEKSIHLFAFFESSLILLVFFVYFSYSFVLIAKRQIVNIYMLYIALTGTILILLGHYPFGVFNPGAAVRYRENFYAFLLLLLFYTYLKTVRHQSKRE